MPKSTAIHTMQLPDAKFRKACDPDHEDNSPIQLGYSTDVRWLGQAQRHSCQNRTFLLRLCMTIALEAPASVS